MAIPARFIDEVKARTVLSDVVGRKVKLVKRGKEHTGLCPFHNEKTPSFTVNDQKGFYHCFGCGEHGSALDFIMNTDGLQFREAVEQLAGLAGMEMPEERPEDRAREAKRMGLSEVMEAVTGWYEAQLAAAVGRDAAEYVAKRGLKPATVGHFRMGYAPARRTALKDAMLARGIPEADLVETGMLIKPEDGGPSYDRFRNRLMFPILDRRERVIAFGGRALDPDAKAKYLNSPETTLFHKGANLYNWPGARKAAFDSGNVIVVEGYMDAIALWEAGIGYAVAPLGTALTEEQIAHIWAMADEPILAFDGDKAGMRAANRAMERALPMLKPGKSLRFLLLEDGEDPDDMVRRAGREAMEAKMDAAIPMVQMLWKNFTDGVNLDTPERRAGLEKTIFMGLAEIADEGVKKLYQSEFRSRVWDLYRAQRGDTGAGSAGGSSPHDSWRSYAKGYGDARRGRGFDPSKPQRSDLKSSRLGAVEGTGADLSKLERLLCLCVTSHPALMVTHEERLAILPFHDPDADDVRAALLAGLSDDLALDVAAVETHLRSQGLGRALDSLRDDLRLKHDHFAYPDAEFHDALRGFEHIVARFEHITVLRQDFERAEADFRADMSEETQARFLAAQRAYRDAEVTEA